MAIASILARSALMSRRAGLQARIHAAEDVADAFRDQWHRKQEMAAWCWNEAPEDYPAAVRATRAARMQLEAANSTLAMLNDEWRATK